MESVLEISLPSSRISSAQPLVAAVALASTPQATVGGQVPSRWLSPRDIGNAAEPLVLGPKRRAHALVIPVINEGERIRRQLARIAECCPRADIVLADGGSSDGSLVLDLLMQTGVRALLTERGPGKLSAQLQTAYAWCLREGYDGIVTVDGNDKDGIEAIDTFVEKLEQGYDYVQGSRYRRGGRGINTPLDRWVGGRLIHAPLLSLASGHWYTDTTNGFRAYSAAYLRDPRVSPFRDVFQAYSLLFYLTIRAGQLGMRTCEVPVTRTYPTRGAVPTKIAGFRQRLRMLGALLDVVRGRYHPGPRCMADPELPEQVLDELPGRAAAVARLRIVDG